MAERWKKNRTDRLTKLARAIELLGERDQNLLSESSRVDRLRIEGAVALHALCREFTEALNGKLTSPAVVLDPADYRAEHFNDGVPGLFQINLRGRLLQLEFEATEELYSKEEFRRPYVLFGTVRSFNQDFLTHNTVGEKSIFYCPEGAGGKWYFFENRTYGSGEVNTDFFIGELQELL